MFKWISRWWYEEKYDKEPEKEEPEEPEPEEPEREPKKSYLDVVKEIVEDEAPPLPARK